MRPPRTSGNRASGRRTASLALVLSIIAGPLGAQDSTLPESAVSARFGPGFNASSLRWTLGRVGLPLSELTYRDMHAVELAVTGSYRQHIVSRWSWAWAVEIRGGPLLTGRVQDSDFTSSFGPYREYSRSISELTGHISVRLVGLGLLHELDHVPLFQLVEVWGGVAQSRLSLRKRNGRQIIPFASTTFLDGLDSRYRAQWMGPWYGGALVVPIGAAELRFVANRHFRTHYRAEGQWNLREDLKQPLSFRQQADGSGQDLRASLGGMILPGVDVVFAADYSTRQARDGSDIPHLVSGEWARNNLAEVDYSDFSFQVLIAIQRSARR